MTRQRMKNRNSSALVLVFGTFTFIGFINIAQFHLHGPELLSLKPAELLTGPPPSSLEPTRRVSEHREEKEARSNVRSVGFKSSRAATAVHRQQDQTKTNQSSSSLEPEQQTLEHNGKNILYGVIIRNATVQHRKTIGRNADNSSSPLLKFRPNVWVRQSSVSMGKRRPHKIGGAGEVNFTMNNGTNIIFPANVTKFYCKRRYDRAGGAIQDYLMAHAFSFHFKRQFAGACGPRWYPQNHESQFKMIELLGFQEELPILDECPNNDTSAMVLDQHLYYMWQDTDIWTTEWIEYIQQRRKETQQQEEEKKNPTLVIHVRRGDVHPCDNYTYSRYLPNSHYLSLIDKYRTEDHHSVILHSEKQSYLEPWSDFDEIDGLELKLDTDPVETWRDILNSDVYIMSKSSFSLVPALFSKASKIIYTPFWHRGQPNWDTVNNDIMNASYTQTAMLRVTNCSEVFDSRNRPLKVSQKLVSSKMQASIRANAAWNTSRPSNRTR